MYTFSNVYGEYTTHSGTQNTRLHSNWTMVTMITTGCNSTTNFPNYHRVSHINKQLKFVCYRGILQLGPFIWVLLILTVLNTVTSLHGMWELQWYRQQHYAITSCLVATSDNQYPHSFLCYHSNLATRNCTISLIHGNGLHFHTGIVKFATLCATI